MVRSVTAATVAGLSYRQVDRIARYLWPELADGPGSRRAFDDRQLAVLDFVGVLYRAGLFHDGVPLSLAERIDEQVCNGEQMTVILVSGDGSGACKLALRR